ncbi:ATP-binding protein [Streptomyces sp. TP-A0356]|uniref:ATP-binding protein n=1 Tax=Streptomyces sp. TP-A0356 TaxID=1359208 RepID=UPI0007C72916
MELPSPDGESAVAVDGKGADERPYACAHHALAGEAGQGGTPAPSSLVTSAASARSHVLAALRSHGDAAALRPTEQAVTDLLLVTSELVSNAIRHGGGLVAFEARPTRDGVRLFVHDRSADIPSAAFGSGELPLGYDGGGYGWPLIIQLARDIAVEPCPGGGKIVSVLVSLTPGPAPVGRRTRGVVPPTGGRKGAARPGR